jgi:hypothetical protein
MSLGDGIAWELMVCLMKAASLSEMISSLDSLSSSVSACCLTLFSFSILMGLALLAR